MGGSAEVEKQATIGGAYLKDHDSAQEFGFWRKAVKNCLPGTMSNFTNNAGFASCYGSRYGLAVQPQACCSFNPGEQQACAVYTDKANPKVGLEPGYFPPLFAFLICWIVCSVSAMQSSVPSLVPFA